MRDPGRHCFALIGGTARVAGYDVVTEAGSLRGAIGLAGQYAAVDELLTGRENLELVGLWYHLGKDEYRRRAREGARANRARRRRGRPAREDLTRVECAGVLDIGASLIASTARAVPRRANWALVLTRVPATTYGSSSKNLVAAGSNGAPNDLAKMEEAEHLAQRIVVIDQGAVIANGTAEQLKEHMGGDTLEARVTDRSAPRASRRTVGRRRHHRPASHRS